MGSSHEIASQASSQSLVTVLTQACDKIGPFQASSIQASASAPSGDEPDGLLFQGLNTATGTACATAVGGRFTECNGSSEVSCSITHSTEELTGAIGISGSVAAKLGLKGFFKAKADFVQSLHLTSTSICIVISVSHSITRKGSNFHLTVPPPADTSAFLTTYGDAFVSSITYGAEYHAVYTFYAETQEERRTLQAQLGINIGRVDAELQTKLDELKKNSKIECVIRQVATGIKNPHLPSPDKMVQYALDFCDKPIDAPTIVGIEMLDYSVVPGIGSAVPPLLTKHHSLEEKLVKVMEITGQLQSLRKIYSFYNDNRKNPDVKAALDEIDAVLGEATKDEETLIKKLKQFDTAPVTLPSLVHGTPKLGLEVMESPVFGDRDSTPNPFSTVDIATYVDRRIRIKAIQLGTSGRRTPYLYGLKITYCSKDLYDDTDHEFTITVEGTTKSGGWGETLQLTPTNRIDKIDGRSASLINTIRITLNDGRSLTAGTSCTGIDYNWQLPPELPHGHILGFKGGYGEFIDHYSIVYFCLTKVRWEK